MYSPELQTKIAEWRRQLADGSLTGEEGMLVMKEAVKLLREGRVSAAYSSEASKRKKAIVAIPKADDLLSELDEI